MRTVHRSVRFSLLTKELIETAQRPRLYIVRAVFGAVLFGLVVIGLATSHRQSVGLGGGRQIFDQLTSTLMIAIHLILPAMTCAAVAHEKERNTLALLLITRLTPRSILWQKLLGRMCSVLSLMLISLPVLAYAYSLGGVTPQQFFQKVALVLLVPWTIAASSLFFSTYARTTPQALIASYAWNLVLPFLPGGGGFIRLGPTWILDIHLFSPSRLLFDFEHLRTMAAGDDSVMTLAVVLSTIAVTVQVLLWMFAAQQLLWRRAFSPPSRWVLRIFRWLDDWFHRLNDNPLTKGRVLIADRGRLPGQRPIAWRETDRQPLGKLRYLIRALLVIELPLLLLIADASSSLNSNAGWFGGDLAENVNEATMLLIGLGWLVGLTLIAVKSASLFAGERSRQTLDVLLTTPLSNADILDQKLAGVRRLVMFVLIPLITLTAFRAWWLSQTAGASPGGAIYFDSDDYQTRQTFPWVLYPLIASLQLWIYPWQVAWTGVILGMVCRNQNQAILGTLLVTYGWYLLGTVPLMFIRNMMFSLDDPMLIGTFWGGYGHAMMLAGASQLMMLVGWGQTGSIPVRLHVMDWFLAGVVAVVVHVSLHGAVMLGLRAFARSRLSRLLGRQDHGLSADELSQDRVPGESRAASNDDALSDPAVGGGFAVATVGTNTSGQGPAAGVIAASG